MISVKLVFDYKRLKKVMVILDLSFHVVTVLLIVLDRLAF